MEHDSFESFFLEIADEKDIAKITDSSSSSTDLGYVEDSSLNWRFFLSTEALDWAFGYLMRSKFSWVRAKASDTWSIEDKPKFCVKIEYFY